MAEGNKALEESIKEAKKNRKRKCCILMVVIICAIVLVTVLFPFLYSVCNKRSSRTLKGESGSRQPIHLSYR